MNRIHGLYLLTSERHPGLAALLADCEAALQGGATVIQYRRKGLPPDRQREEASALLALCQRHRRPLIINDDVELAAAIGADGVHLGRDDGALAAARQRLGPQALIGASCYDQLALARQAHAAGASYLAFGSFFASPTKPHAVRPPPALLTAARRELPLPLVAIGGITAENGGVLIDAGADALAVISAVLDAPDISGAAARFTRLFATTGDPTP